MALMEVDVVSVGVGWWFLTMLASGLFGVLISTWIYARRENHRFRVDTLKRFAANRYDHKGDEFSRALNEIFVVFNTYPKVMEALRRFHGAVTSGGGDSEDRLVELYKTMCDACRIDYKQFNDSFFLRPFNTRPGSASAQARGDSVS